MKPDSNRLFALDLAVILVVSLAICVASQKLVFMSVFVPLVLAGRMALFAVLAGRDDSSLKAEFAFYAVCTLLGAFNDWNSVCRKRIYDYTVPHFFEFSTIPIWMLLYWGAVLRFVARLARWQGLDPGEEVSNRVGIGPWKVDTPAGKIVVELALIAATRWTLYRNYLDPVLSWLPFVLALMVFCVLLEPSRHDLKLLAAALVGGPVIEILYIQVGRLHQYHLGWIGGVPVWIVCWWCLAALIWKDLTFRAEKGLRSLFPRPGREAEAS